MEPVRGDEAGHVRVEGLGVQGSEPGEELAPPGGERREVPGAHQLVQERLVIVDDLHV